MLRRIAPLSCLALAWLVISSTSSGGGSSAAAGSPDIDSDVETATFSMYCYWTGEATLGRVDGVLASRIGHWDGKEIVQVDYDPRRTDPAAMVKALRSQRSFYSVAVSDNDGAQAVDRFVKSRDIAQLAGEPHFIEPKHSLRTRHPDLWSLELSESQAIALNSWSYFGGPMPDVLNDEQKRTLANRRTR